VTLSGGRTLDPTRPAAGPIQLHADIFSRTDVIGFQTAPVDREIELIGNFHLVVPLASASPGPLVALLCTVDEQGLWTALLDGCAVIEEELRDAVVSIPVGTIALGLPAGTCLGLVVLLSFFPAYWYGLQTALGTAYADRWATIAGSDAKPAVLTVPLFSSGSWEGHEGPTA